MAIGARGHPHTYKLQGVGDFGYTVSETQYQHGGAWQQATWPFTDLAGAQSLTQAAPGTFWAVGNYSVTEKNPNGDGYVGYLVPVMLYYTNGTWHQYGR